MVALFMLLVVVGAMMFAGVALAASIVLRVLFGLILLPFKLLFLPFRLIGLFLMLPFMLLRAVIGGLFGLILVPIFAIGAPLLFAGSIIAIVLFSLLTPLIPLLAIGGLIYLLVKASSRPVSI
jgi:hypothetical protein